MSPHDLLAEELAASAAALRELARDLIGGSDADDLVQETMLRAWRSPPPERVGMAAWLATVLRNLASNRRRDARRRLRREHEAALRRAAEGGEVERPEHEVLRDVTHALWRLPEPYQGTLAMRYFAGLSPKQIAARADASLATVKSRLQRGLVMLREALDRRGADRRGADWRAGLVLAAGLGVTTTRVMGILLMTSTTKLGLGVAAAAAMALLWLSLRSEVAPPQRDAAMAATAAPVQAVRDVPDDVAAREAVATPPTLVDEALLAHSFAFAVDCTVRDRDGLLVPGAQIAISPRDVAPNTWHQSVGDSGVVHVEWRGKLPSMTVWIGVVHDGRGEGLREMTVTAGQPSAVALLVGDGGGGGACGAALRSASVDCRMCHVEATTPHLFSMGQLAGGGGRHPFATFSADLCRNARPGEVVFDEVSTSNFAEASPATRDARPPVVTGTVRGLDGAPRAGVTVAWLRAPEVAGGRTRTAQDGSYRLVLPHEGEVELAVGGGPDGREVLRVELAAGATVQRDVLLGARRGVTGQVLVDAGTKLDGWRVEYVADGAAWCDGAEVRGDGAFVLADLPTVSGRVLLWNADGRVPVAVAEAAATGAVVTFDLHGAAWPQAVLRLRLAGPSVPIADGAQIAAVLEGRVQPPEVFAWHELTGRGAVMVRRDEGFVLEGLAAGFYRLVALGAPFGSCDLGRHWVDGRGLVDLGDCRLPAPGVLRVQGAGEDLPPDFVELCLRRPDVDLQTSLLTVGPADVELPAGEWLLLGGGLEQPMAAPFAVRSGAVLELPAGGR